MPTVRTRRRSLPVLALAVALVISATATAAPTLEGEPVAPVETPGTDPVLDDLEVVSTSATRDAEGRWTDAQFAQSVATLKAIGADDARKRQEARLADADGRVTSARTALVEAQGVLDDESERLAERKATQRTRRRALAVQQEELRRLAVGVLMSEPTDDFAWLGAPDDLTTASRRDAVRDRGIDQQSARVERAKGPWEEARDATAAQQAVVDDATDAVAEATDALETAVDERDHAAEKLRAAEDQAAARLADLTAAEEVTHEAAVVRRTARLTALVDGQDLRLVALDAYWRAAGGAPCTIPWWVLAGVGRTETRHGTAHGSTVTAEGDTTVHILGIPLAGQLGVAVVGDSDGGALDGDPVYDRAVGPMQFIPSTWRRWATDGNADGTKDPHNIYDAAAAAAAYLCFGRGDLTTEGAIRGALLSYNASIPYGNIVLAEGDRYRRGIDLPDRPQDLPDGVEADD